jgi:uncharacterized protein
MSNEVESPCLGICTMNEKTGFCLGCYRTIDEIREWDTMSNEDKQKTVDALEQRMNAAFE